MFAKIIKCSHNQEKTPLKYFLLGSRPTINNNKKIKIMGNVFPSCSQAKLSDPKVANQGQNKKSTKRTEKNNDFGT